MEHGLSDNQFNLLLGVIVTGLGGIAAAIRFSVGRVVKALDANTGMMLENTKSNVVLSTKIDTVATYVQGRSRVPSEVKDFIREEISGVHAAAVVGPEDITPVETPQRPTGGAYSKIKRAKSEPGGGR